MDKFFETFNHQTQLLRSRSLEFVPTSQGFACSLPNQMAIAVLPGRIEVSHEGRTYRQLYQSEAQLKSALLHILRFSAPAAAASLGPD